MFLSMKKTIQINRNDIQRLVCEALKHNTLLKKQLNESQEDDEFEFADYDDDDSNNKKGYVGKYSHYIKPADDTNVTKKSLEKIPAGYQRTMTYSQLSLQNLIKEWAEECRAIAASHNSSGNGLENIDRSLFCTELYWLVYKKCLDSFNTNPMGFFITSDINKMVALVNSKIGGGDYISPTKFDKLGLSNDEKQHYVDYYDRGKILAYTPEEYQQLSPQDKQSLIPWRTTDADKNPVRYYIPAKHSMSYRINSAILIRNLADLVNESFASGFILKYVPEMIVSKLDPFFSIRNTLYGTISNGMYILYKNEMRTDRDANYGDNQSEDNMYVSDEGRSDITGYSKNNARTAKKYIKDTIAWAYKNFDRLGAPKIVKGLLKFVYINFNEIFNEEYMSCYSDVLDAKAHDNSVSAPVVRKLFTKNFIEAYFKAVNSYYKVWKNTDGQIESRNNYIETDGGFYPTCGNKDADAFFKGFFNNNNTRHDKNAKDPIAKKYGNEQFTSGHVELITSVDGLTDAQVENVHFKLLNIFWKALKKAGELRAQPQHANNTAVANVSEAKIRKIANEVLKRLNIL